jgi:cytochrome c-type biogenesis protein CcmH
MKHARKFALALGFIVVATHALAVQPSEVMPDPALETRARTLSAELRCLVCQNQSIDDSDADLARDIRVLIRERIAKGESNDTVRAFLVSRYGDFILLQPPFKFETLLLWLCAPLTLLFGGFFVVRSARRARGDTPSLNPDEEAQLAKIESAEIGG